MYGSVDLSVPSRKGATIASGVVNLTNTIVGAGMLGLPGAFGGTGWLSGVVLIVLSAAFSAHGLVLLSKAAVLTGRPSSFYSVALASVPRYTILIDLAVALKCFGVATGVFACLGREGVIPYASSCNSQCASLTKATSSPYLTAW